MSGRREAEFRRRCGQAARALAEMLASGRDLGEDCPQARIVEEVMTEMIEVLDRAEREGVAVSRSGEVDVRVAAAREELAQALRERIRARVWEVCPGAGAVVVSVGLSGLRVTGIVGGSGPDPGAEVLMAHPGLWGVSEDLVELRAVLPRGERPVMWDTWRVELSVGGPRSREVPSGPTGSGGDGACPV